MGPSQAMPCVRHRWSPCVTLKRDTINNKHSRLRYYVGRPSLNIAQRRSHICYKCKKLTSLKLVVRTLWWYHSTKTAKIFLGNSRWGYAWGVHKLPHAYHHIVLTVSFKLQVFYIYICCFTTSHNIQTELEPILPEDPPLRASISAIFPIRTEW